MTITLFQFFREAQAAKAERRRIAEADDSVRDLLIRITTNSFTWRTSSRKMTDRVFLGHCRAEIERRAYGGVDAPALTKFSNDIGLIAHLAAREGV